MKRSHLEGERLDARDVSSAAFTASMFAASVGMIWDLATGHVAAFDRMLSNISEDSPHSQNTEQDSTRAPSRRLRSISGDRTDA